MFPINMSSPKWLTSKDWRIVKVPPDICDGASRMSDFIRSIAERGAAAIEALPNTWMPHLEAFPLNQLKSCTIEGCEDENFHRANSLEILTEASEVHMYTDGSAVHNNDSHTAWALALTLM